MGETSITDVLMQSIHFKEMDVWVEFHAARQFVQGMPPEHYRKSERPNICTVIGYTGFFLRWHFKHAPPSAFIFLSCWGLSLLYLADSWKVGWSEAASKRSCPGSSSPSSNLFLFFACLTVAASPTIDFSRTAAVWVSISAGSEFVCSQCAMIFGCSSGE